MANQVAARLAGDDYQHLTSWLHLLELKRPHRQIRVVSVEDETAGSADDVTVRHDSGSSHKDRFYQIKFHVDQRSGYSTNLLTYAEPGSTSLLQKLYVTWTRLNGEIPGKGFEIHFVSNWSWDPSEKVATCFSGRDNGVSEGFLSASPRSGIGKAREEWRNHLGSDQTRFVEFIRTLHFDLGATCFDERRERVRDQMEHLGLRHDDAALLVAVGIVRAWIRSGKQNITLDILDQAIKSHDLASPIDTECFLTVLLTTVKKQRIDIVPDFIIDWRDRFEGPDYEKGHATKQGVDWNDDLMPELYALEARLSEESGCRLVRARGLARLSAWFGFGRVFSESSRYILEADQRGFLWRSDAQPSSDFRLVPTEHGERSPSGTVAIVLSLTSDATPSVEQYLEEQGLHTCVLQLKPERPLGHDSVGGAPDAVACARQAKDYIRTFTTRHRAKQALFFYLGPLSVACFMGHFFTAMGCPIQFMEYQDPGYAPSVLLQ